jgi:hypothetical protein
VDLGALIFAIAWFAGIAFEVRHEREVGIPPPSFIRIGVITAIVVLGYLALRIVVPLSG